MIYRIGIIAALATIIVSASQANVGPPPDERLAPYKGNVSFNICAIRYPSSTPDGVPLAVRKTLPDVCLAVESAMGLPDGEDRFLEPTYYGHLVPLVAPQNVIVRLVLTHVEGDVSTCIPLEDEDIPEESAAFAWIAPFPPVACPQRVSWLGPMGTLGTDRHE